MDRRGASLAQRDGAECRGDANRDAKRGEPRAKTVSHERDDGDTDQGSWRHRERTIAVRIHRDRNLISTNGCCELLSGFHADRTRPSAYGLKAAITDATGGQSSFL